MHKLKTIFAVIFFALFASSAQAQMRIVEQVEPAADSAVVTRQTRQCHSEEIRTTVSAITKGLHLNEFQIIRVNSIYLRKCAAQDFAMARYEGEELTNQMLAIEMDFRKELVALLGDKFVAFERGAYRS